MRTDIATVAELDQFDALLDVRSPAEFAEDHIPAAVNVPVLDDAERARVGTLYKQVSPFLARKVGAAWVARNIARHIDEKFVDQDRRWHPLVYCWRGGKRSAAMTIILREIGWDARQLEGGYKAFRRHVIDELEMLPPRLDLHVICGMTGAGKSHLIRALAAKGAQVIDLESLAAHRGSVLGGLPEAPQPTQKAFETRLWQALRKLDPRRPVYVESESRKIGDVRVPEPLVARMWAAPCVVLEAGKSLRVALLMDEYAHFLTDRTALADRLSALTALHGRARIAHWLELVDANRHEELVGELLEQHYDPAYRRSIGTQYGSLATAPLLTVAASDGAAAFDRLAAQVLDEEQVPA